MKKLKFNSTLNHKKSDYQTREIIVEKRFANWGTAWNGVCITAPIIFPKSEREYILQDVLELIVPAKYWLSEEATAKIAGKLNK